LASTVSGTGKTLHSEFMMSLSTEQQMLVEQRLANDGKSMLVAYLLLIFLGGFGAHRFYLGRTGSALAMLALLILGFLTIALVVGAFLLGALGIWVIVDLFPATGSCRISPPGPERRPPPDRATAATIPACLPGPLPLPRAIGYRSVPWC
jgi:TM2 domain-containing membrane protein YozV